MVIISLSEREDPGSSPGRTTILSRGVMATRLALNEKSSGSIPDEITKRSNEGLPF